ncbi:hypothetical protein [Burkholderia alba]|uniref:hypothetical protein n=1 Tax=Burkholderia alba TaxID=2683677 RepID=UPI002B061C23|nr:hypothetical protein [Burkholderia alba]
MIELRASEIQKVAGASTPNGLIVPFVGETGLNGEALAGGGCSEPQYTFYYVLTGQSIPCID